MTFFTEIITDGRDFSLVLGLLAATLEQFDAFAAALICEQRPVRLVEDTAIAEKCCYYLPHFLMLYRVEI